MVQSTSKHRLDGSSRSAGEPPPCSRAPASPWWSRCAQRARRRQRTCRATSIAVAGAGSLCLLIACALAVPSFVLGADQPPVDQDLHEVVAASPADPPATAGSPTAALNQTATDQTALALDATGLPANGDLLVTLPWGNGPGEVGLLEATEGLARGPEALAVAPDGRIAVLDSVNARLLLLDPTGRPLETALIPLSSPRFLAVDDERPYILDCDADRRLVAFDWNGVELGAMALPELSDVVTGLFATDQGPCVDVSHETVVLLTLAGGGYGASAAKSLQPDRAIGRTLAGRPLDQGLRRVTQVTFQPGRNARIKSFDLDGATLKVVQTGDSSPVLAGGRAIEHLVSADGDGAGGMIVGARLLKPEVSGGREASLALTRLVAAEVADPSTTPAANSATASPSDNAQPTTNIMFLTDSPFAYLGQPYVVAPDGRIFQPWGTEAGYSILVHSFAQVEEVQR